MFLEGAKMIEAIIFSYKNKNLKKVAETLVENTSLPIHVKIYDQHNLDRQDLFKNQSFEYSHVFWDEIVSPAEYKANIIYQTESEYILVISDDILVSKDWDKTLVEFLNTKDVVVSGSGSLRLSQENPFFLTKNISYSDDFSLTGFIDKNFIFTKTKNIKEIYPTTIKYRGEEELLSLDLFLKNIEIFSSPSDTYKDLGERTMETKYVPFSLNHGYNDVVERLKSAPSNFFKMLRIFPGNINKLPFATDDVLYDPYELEFQDLDGRKFILSVRGIS